MSALSHSRARQLMREHFALDITAEGERSLREHLLDCHECSLWYERHLVVALLDPQAAGAEQRLLGGLGIAPRPRKRASSLQLGLATALVALGAFVLYARAPAEFSARGAGGPSKLAQVFAYQVVAGERASVIGKSIHAHDELAFAYVNPAGFKKLMIFGVDEHSHVFWYHPAWSNPSQTPRAIDILPGTELRELPEAIAHDLDGKNLKIHVLFSNADVSVRDVERMLKGSRTTGNATGGLPAMPGQGLESEISVVVE
jgi:hypothetical protein